jgi:nucleotide-binding universal stress UspA family protein
MKAKRILVPLDGSPRAESALPKALELLSDRPGATLILLRAVETSTTPGVDPIDRQVAVVQEAEPYLAAVAERLYAQGIHRVVRSIWYTSPAKAIIEAARVRAVDMIVMSTHGRDGMPPASQGSVAESVLRGTTKPIVFVSAGGAVEVRSRADSAVADSGQRAERREVMSSVS